MLDLASLHAELSIAAAAPGVRRLLLLLGDGRLLAAAGSSPRAQAADAEREGDADVTAAAICARAYRFVRWGGRVRLARRAARGRL